MKPEQIEKLLRQGADIRAPDGLLGRLKANIRIPRADLHRSGFDARPSWFKRWMPALALTSILLLCVVAMAVQTNIILELKQQNEALRAATGNLEALRTANAEFQKLTAQNQELDRLRKDNAELQELRVEVVQLGQQVQEGEKLRAENMQLRNHSAPISSRYVEMSGSSQNRTTDVSADPHVRTAAAQLAAFAIALDLFEVENGFYPRSNTGLDDLIVKPRNASADWHAYLDNIPLDPWGKAYIYVYPAGTARLRMTLAHPDRTESPEPKTTLTTGLQRQSNFRSQGVTVFFCP